MNKSVDTQKVRQNDADLSYVLESDCLSIVQFKRAHFSMMTMVDNNFV